jgi:tetratricopeptide (TPR) repeat protein
METKFRFLVCLIVLISCRDKNDNNSQEAILYKKASEIFKHNHSNSDSLLYAIALIDSAIKLDSNRLDFMFTKCQIAMEIKRYNLVINSCSKILKIDSNNYLAFLQKGVAFEHLINFDSANSNYKGALKSLEVSKFQKKIFKDYQRLILYNLLNDSINYKIELNEFHKQYVNDKEFDVYNQDLIHFNRSDYIQSY